MKIGIASMGSRGDIQPFIALAIALREIGHEPTIISAGSFGDFVKAFQIPFIPLSMDPETSITDPKILGTLKKGNIIRFVLALQKVMEEQASTINAELIEACGKFDYLVASSVAAISVLSIAEKYHKKPALIFLSMPITPTRVFPHSVFGNIQLGILNKFTYRLNDLIWLTIRKMHLDFRASLGLPKKNMTAPLTRANFLTIYPMSRYLLVRPSDWPSNTHVTGFLNIPAAARTGYDRELPSPQLEQWLLAGERPVYMGFGSVPIPDTEKWMLILADLLDQTPHRILFCTGWTALESLPTHPRLFVVKSVDHSIILPRCKAAIIHGGMGTTAAVMQAGIPGLVVSILADQPYIGSMVERKKIGRHVPFKKVTSTRVRSALAQILSEEFVRNARKLGELLSTEDGAKESAVLIEDHFASSA